GSLLLTGCTASEVAPNVPSGWYGDQLQVAFHPVSKELSAIYFDQELSGDTCQIYLVGKLLGPKANLISWPLEKRKYKSFGIIRYETEGQLSMILEADLSACHEKVGFQLDQPQHFKLSDPAPWIRIQSVKRASTALLDKANGTDTLKMLQRYDIVRTLQQQEDWVQVSVPVDSSESIGWLPVAHLRRFPG
ncbi:MAG: hypothetical protein AAFV80_15005, partial [Bacteroidota bacterium]